MKYQPILLATLVVASATPGFADLVLTVDPMAQTRFLGEQATVAIKSSGDVVGDYDLNISWDPSIVSFSSLSLGTQLGFSIQSVSLGPGSVNASEISIDSSADLIALQPGQTATLMTLVFDTIAVGTSPVNIGVVTIGDELGNRIDTTTTGGSIEVMTMAAVVPEPSAFLYAGLVATVVGVFALRRRLRKPWAGAPAGEP